MQPLALLGGGQLLCSGSWSAATSSDVVLPVPGSGSRVTLGGTTSGALSSILGSRVRESWPLC